MGAVVLCRPSPLEPTKCDNSHCPQVDPKMLNIHLVPHTHDDVGWLKTVDQYFYGSRTNIQKAGVQYIIDSVVQSLLRNETRKFIYVETAFFWKWWKLQTPELQEKVKKLVNDGQLEFINGGWCMNDEAAAHYQSIVDQMTWGHRRLQDTFGTCGIPKIGWQIDPFGHSREQASLFAQIGFDGLFLQRLDYDDQNKRKAEKRMELIWQGSDDLGSFDGLFLQRLDYDDQNKRKAEKRMELIWQGSDDLGSAADMFTHAMEMGYGPPSGLNWELAGNSFNQGNDDPIIDDPESEDYNVDKTVDWFINYAKQYSNNYATNNILFPMGTDFYYQSAEPYFKNMDKLIKYVNERKAKGSNINAFYSTPTCYMHGIHLSNYTFTTKKDDFFPYATAPHSFFTGYFTSRPALKRYEKVGNNFLQTCKQLDVLSLGNGKNEEKMTALREWMGVLQHHDAITGTESQHVADNYALILYKSIEKCKSVVNQSLNTLIAKSDPTLNQLFCNALNVSACAVTEGTDNLAVTIYNPFGHNVNPVIRLPVTTKNYKVLDPKGKDVKSDIVPIPPAVLNLAERVSKAKDELVFKAELPALGFATYLLKANGPQNGVNEAKVTKITEAFNIKSKSLNILFDKTGALNAIQLKDGKVVDFKQNFEYYKAHDDHSGEDHQPSGAYILRSDGDTPVIYETGLQSELVETSDAKEVYQKVNEYISQVIRISENSDVIELDFTVGPIPVDNKIGKEIISRWETNLTTNGLFYTDANGRQLLERKRDFRPTWKLTVNEEIAGNYYPVNSRIAMKDVKQDIQMTVLNDRSQGGSSIKDGSVELMVHRRDLFDDVFGVAEALNEPGFDGKGLQIMGKFWIHFTSIAEAAEAHRETAFDILMEPSLTFAKYSGSEEEYLKSHKTQYSGLTKELPKNVHLLTLEQWKGSSYLLRLEHFYQQNESQTLSKPVTLDLKDLFTINWKGSSYLLRLEHFYQQNESQTLSKPVTLDLKDLFTPFVVTKAVETTLSA
ncbi:unnamed protein product [Oppiella nova]|uniref:Alpha-mannosidase n=1 Tax=Oppiella nova TaxID=334625 RepID=A0A7R9M7C2_9ACAR|nr:unnamed protein product [Oppiella nova]CAG2170825.1 unnamed protein product [Oppiella nova]